MKWIVLLMAYATLFPLESSSEEFARRMDESFDPPMYIDTARMLPKKVPAAAIIDVLPLAHLRRREI